MNYSVLYYRYRYFQKDHFMFSGRYSSHIQDFQDIIRRIFGSFRPRLFPTNQKNGIQHFEIYKHISFKNYFHIFSDIESRYIQMHK